MCDYSLHNVKSRPAKVGDKLKTHYFNLGTRGFAAPEDANTAVCVLPGTELAFATAARAIPAAIGQHVALAQRRRQDGLPILHFELQSARLEGDPVHVAKIPG